ncbi:hypothetical protein [Steroidobacter agaridevorans]|uniref:hypothetical protein n=1 Tax=Steroidobacter agaridevorans TaxID=2695856 RepID=UPI001326FEF6|nr:hypothetical protein [Steroidobacter agaridevorans]GFE90278.1 hypothetical protein GCM10011488_52320 [Steroidobacter agaridevorans]
MNRALARLTVTLVMGSMLVLVCACGKSEATKPEASLTPAERASLERIVNDIKQASRRGFETGDWSVMAKLYPEGSLACWDASGEEHRFGFLSMEPIPDHAQYQVGSLDDYIHGGVDTSHMGGTHFMAIRYEASFASGCDLPTPKRWPERHIYLRKVGEKFIPVHPCPVQEQIEQKSIVRTWPMVSGAQAARVVEGMSEQERQSLREKVRQDRFPLNAILSIQDRHGLSYEQASLVLDRVCTVTARER